MRRIFLIIILASLVIYGAEFEIKLEGYKDEYIIGEPINICAEVEYKGEGKKTIAKGYNGFKIEIVITDLEGNKIESKIKEESKICLINSFIEIERGWKESKCEELTFGRALNKDEYYVYAYAGSKGPYYRKGKDGNDLIKEDAWEGKIETEKKKIRIVEPEGIDREAYEYFKGCPFCKKEQLLEKYPTSTYAGWVLRSLPSVEWTVRREKYIKEIENYIELVKNFANVHPDFPLAGYLAYQAASYAMDLKDYNSACILYKISEKSEWVKMGALDENAIKKSKEDIKASIEKLKKEGRCKN